MENNFQRARTDAQKNERRQEFMQIADHQFKTMPYQDITLSTIAKELGSSRANLYKYVHTKEEIFLLLYLRKQKECMKDFKEALPEVPCQPDEFAKITANIFNAHLDYVHYHSILSQIIEKNVTLDALTSFKKQSNDDRQDVYDFIQKQCPSFTKKQTSQMYLTFLYEACGLYAHTEAGDLTKEAMKQAGLPVPNTDSFKKMMAEYLTVIIQYYKPFTD